jgi:nucleoside 2-deoxyribosyltransferase
VIHIVGGCYFERCEYPYWNQYFGSAGRAAAAARAFSPVTLQTCTDKDSEANARILAAEHRLVLKTTRVPAAIRFHYLHALSRPSVDNVPSAPYTQLTVRAGAVLRFGMLEADAVVHGGRVVYDPQSSARAFIDNGSSAEQLAIVANEDEICALAKMDDAVKAARVLARRRVAQVVVIKRGAVGAYVCEGRHAAHISSYCTPHVWKIGSGDIFAGVFAALWTKGTKASVSAEVASRAVASYCATQVLPIPRDVRTRSQFPRFRPSARRKARIYLAGPFFSMAQRWMIDEARAALLDMGVDVFSPVHDVGFGDADKVAAADLSALERCSAVFAVIEGLDSGTLFEAGYARSRGIPVIAYVENEKKADLLMLEGSGCAIFTDFVSAIYHATWAALG